MAVPEDKWQTAVRQFTVLKWLLEMDGIERTRAAVEKVAKILKKHPLRSIDGSNPTIAPGASQSYCARIALIVARADFQVRSTRSLKVQLRRSTSLRNNLTSAQLLKR